MSVHPSRGAWEVRWREPGGKARSKRLHDEAKAHELDAELRQAKHARTFSPGPGASESIYPYETKAGTRYLFKYRRSDGTSDTKRGFASRAAARKARRSHVSAVERGEVRVCREDFATFFDSWLRGRRPFLSPGTFANYRVHGEKRLKPAFGSETPPSSLRPTCANGWPSRTSTSRRD